MPNFEHDCNRCVFLGELNYSHILYDLYVCPKKDSTEISTVVARYSSDGPDYISGLNFAKNNFGDTSNILKKALNLALEKGFYVDKN